MPTVAEYREFFRGYNPSGGGAEEWNMWCQAFVHRAAAFAAGVDRLRVYPTARAARLASGKLNPDHTTAPVGAIGYWAWDPDDDVAVHIGGGIWMRGSRHVTTQFGGVARNAGTSTFAEFQARARLRFLGWSLTNGGNVVPVEAEPTLGYRRIVGASGVSKRTIPTTVGNSPIGDISAGDWGDFDGFIRGQDPYGRGNNIWFRGKYSGTYFYSGAFLDSGTHDLADLGTWSKATTPAPAPTPPAIPNNANNPGAAPYVFSVDLAVVDRVLPAARTNWEPGNFPARPTSVVIHQWDDPAKNPSLEGVLNKARTPQPDSNVMAPHFVIDAKGTIIQMVSLKDRAYHAGKGGNGMVGIEVEPHFGPATIAGLVRLLIALGDRNGGVPLLEVLHREVAATACGKDVAPHLAAIKSAVRYVEPEPVPVPEPEPVAEPEPEVKPKRYAGPIGLVLGLLAALGAIIAALVQGNS